MLIKVGFSNPVVLLLYIKSEGLARSGCKADDSKGTSRQPGDTVINKVNSCRCFDTTEEFTGADIYRQVAWNW